LPRIITVRIGARLCRSFDPYPFLSKGLPQKVVPKLRLHRLSLLFHDLHSVRCCISSTCKYELWRGPAYCTTLPYHLSPSGCLHKRTQPPSWRTRKNSPSWMRIHHYPMSSGKLLSSNVTYSFSPLRPPSSNSPVPPYFFFSPFPTIFPLNLVRLGWFPCHPPLDLAFVLCSIRTSSIKTDLLFFSVGHIFTPFPPPLTPLSS